MKNKIALGTLQFSGWYSQLSDEKIIDIIRTFIESGGSYIDTAPLYGFGKSDKLLSKALASYDRKSYILISKCGFANLEKCTTVEEAKNSHKDTSYNAILNDFEKSLERLKTDYIDTYLLHTRDSKTPLEESVRALNYLKSRKKVKYIGICNTTLEEIKYINQYYKIDYIQNRFSLINRSINEAFASYLLDNDISVMPFRVIDYGLLTNKSASNDHILLNRLDARTNKPDLQPDKQEKILKWVREDLTPIAHSLGITVAQLCIAWTLKQNYVSTPIIGITKKQYISENLQANSIDLSDTSVAQIDQTYKRLKNMIWEEYKQPVHTFRGLNERYY